MAIERDRLIELAPHYYTIAICNFFEKRDVASANSIWASITSKNGPVFWHALRGLVQKDMLAAFPDEFGPTVYKRTGAFKDQWEGLKKLPEAPYSPFALDPARGEWIESAMVRVNQALEEQKIKDEDLLKADAEWEPLPVDRQNQKLQKATEELDKTIAAIEADNGYNASQPEEKTFVVETLKEAAGRLKKDDAVSYAYLKRKVLDVLDMVIRRFGKAAVGLTAQAAKAAMFDWLKEIAGKALH